MERPTVEPPTSDEPPASDEEIAQLDDYLEEGLFSNGASAEDE